MHVLIPVAMLMFVSCEFEEEQMGLPRTVTFPKEGGERTLTANQDFNQLCIEDGSDIVGYSGDNSEGVMKAEYKWLKVKSPCLMVDSVVSLFGNKLTVTVAPSSEKNSRSLRVYVYSGNKYATIKVKQK